ncbi:molybdopterin molybdochelatase [Leucobacter luti]|uniref:Molybdopterin molybdenumtransferase n=1 Tax=Leucobacter luti TaxID=340320 RepID=A0A4R6S6N1_9MICO|nr:gephyrin-like molybdotransferase Glp [Leucobacter luti]TDP94445.1 molybdopterin molybdochelatase [Leucobacter luti]
MRTVTAHTALVRGLLDPMLAELAQATPEHVGIGHPELAGRVIAIDLTAATPLPPFENSQMDGYAVRHRDLLEAAEAAEPADPAAARSASITLPIGRTVAAGDAPIPHAPGTASPVMTGAAMPVGADTVIPVERANPAHFTELSRAGDPEPSGTVTFASTPPRGEFVRARGSDLPAGATLLTAGTRLTPARIGLLAGAGVAEVPVRVRPRVLLVATGDEVADPGAIRTAGQIHDANTPLLAALLTGLGAEVRTRRTGDTAAELQHILTAAAESVDLIVTSGGISAGAYEVVRDALTEYGVEFAGLALQPGGPQGLGRWAVNGSAVPVLCFPGNPVSSALSAELFVAPALRGYAGRPEALPVEQRTLAHELHSPLHKHQVRRGRLDADGRVHVTAPGSHLLADLAAAELLAHVPVGVEHLPAGSPIEIWRLHD